MFTIENVCMCAVEEKTLFVSVGRRASRYNRKEIISQTYKINDEMKSFTLAFEKAKPNPRILLIAKHDSTKNLLLNLQ